MSCSEAEDAHLDLIPSIWGDDDDEDEQQGLVL